MIIACKHSFMSGYFRAHDDFTKSMRKIKTKAELKAVGEQEQKQDKMPPLTCGLCYKVI